MTRYVVTESVHFKDPDKQYMDIADGTVCGVFDSKSDAKARILNEIQCELFRGSKGKSLDNGNGFLIDGPGYYGDMRAEWRIHEWDDRMSCDHAS